MARGIALLVLVALVACDSESAGAGDTDAGHSTAADEGSTGEPATTSQPSTSEPGGSTSMGPQTSSDDGSTSATSADPPETEGSTGEPEGVAVVVSIAHGGQTARSCDGGQTWSDFHEFGVQDDHSDYAAFGGMTFGNGAFVAATGWGASGRILRSTDGVSWEDLPDDAFVTPEGVGRPSNGASGVEFVGDGFVLLAGAYLWRSNDGSAWTAESPPTLSYAGHFREVEYLPEPGLLLIATENSEAPQPWTVQVSADGGATWQSGTGATSGCVGWVQHAGGFAASGGRLLLAGGMGPTCISDDGGLTWAEAGDVGAEIADVESYDAGFVVLVQSGDVFVSEDGQSWTLHGNAGLDGGRLAWDEELGFFGEGGARYAHSSDGAMWTPAVSRPPEGYIHVREFAVGRIDACP